MLRRLTHTLAATVSSRVVAADVAGALLRGAFGEAKRAALTVGRTPDLRAEKIVSHKYRYVWLCNPKAASRTIKTVLVAADPAAEIHEASVSAVYARCPEAKRYYSFAFVRHPFARALSFHSELHFAHRTHGGGQRSLKEGKRRGLLHGFHGLARTKDFGEYCRWLNTPYGADACADRHFLSQHVQIRLEDGRLPDFVGRFERLDADFERVAARLGMTGRALPLLNTIAGWQTTPEALTAARSAAAAHLTERNRALLRARYAADLSLGGYSPDLP